MFKNLSLFDMSSAMARHAGQRQALVAQNMANADTPDYRPKDLPAFKASFDSLSGLKATRASHLHGSMASSSPSVAEAQSSSMSPNGNAVSLDEEMLRAVDVKRQHDRALSIYRHTMTVLRASIGSGR